MLVGIPKEVKAHESRVGATPEIVHALLKAGHRVRIESQAGAAVGYPDEAYAPAAIVATADEVYEADLIVKVKEPQPSEIPLLKEGQILFTYLHLAADRSLTESLMKRKVIAIAYETLTDSQGRLPLLLPMSQIAGRVSVQMAATFLQTNHGGRGLLLGPVENVPPAKVLIIGAGIAGTQAAEVAHGMGAAVTLLDINPDRLASLPYRTRLSTPESLAEELRDAAVTVGALLVPGAAAPKVITPEHLSTMLPGSVFFDIAIDQGGCAETSRPTTLSNPTFTVDSVVHACVTNLPASCGRTATQALTAATAPYILALASDPTLAFTTFSSGLNLYLGHCTHPAVAATFSLPLASVSSLGWI